MENEENSFEISRILCRWYEENKRSLPWRQTRDPYRIWLSEVILQQTRIAQGLPYYLDFLRTFPDVQALAAADETSILRHWQGLGYYSRARNLHQAARSIVSDYGGQFPRRYEDILRLKGIGRYTASAIASFAFDEPCPVVDGNVYRVLARLYDIDANILDTGSEKLFLELARQTMEADRAAMHNQAIMEFGALCCTPARPDCEHCPLAERCLALTAGTVDRRPVRLARVKKRTRFFHYLCLYDGQQVWMQQRVNKDIWQHLWEFPLIEDPAGDWASLIAGHPQIAGWMGQGAEVSQAGSYTHQLTHQKIVARFYFIRTGPGAQSPSQSAVGVPVHKIDDYPVCVLTERWLRRSSDLLC
ncbi:MAG: A/G-specific adenine glycosylase [Bacteroidales bacterium]|nr:A/G-specific adenine glycosylase [Bacteroidales bacterium]